MVRSARCLPDHFRVGSRGPTGPSTQDRSQNGRLSTALVRLARLLSPPGPASMAAMAAKVSVSVVVLSVLTFLLSACGSDPEPLPISASVMSVGTVTDEQKVNVVYEVENDTEITGEVECDLSAADGGPGVSIFLAPMTTGEKQTDDVNFDIIPGQTTPTDFDIKCTISE